MPVGPTNPIHFCLGFVFLSATVVVGVEPNKSVPLEPYIAAASDEARQSMETIQIPDNWQIELVAAEPDVANIVAFDVDHQGRIYVCESFRQNRGVTDNRGHNEQWLLADLAAETVQDRIDYHRRLLGNDAAGYTQQDDRVRRLVDTDGDGQVDQSTIVANGFNRIEEGTGAGILVRGSRLYFACIPKLWLLTDTDDDGQADSRTVLSDGYGVRVAFRGHDLHGLRVGPDGRLYFSIGDRGYHVTTQDGRLLADPASGAVFRCELDGSRLEVFATGLRNPQELAFNDVGDLFTVDNNSDSGDKARLVHLLQGGDSGWRMHYQYLPDRGPFNRDRLWEPFHHEQPAYLNPPMVNFADGPSGLTFYPGTGFGNQLNHNFLICDFRGTPSQSGVRSFALEPDGAGYQLATDDRPIWSVLATDIEFAPDGSLLVSDWVDGWDGVGKGRLYRLTSPEHADSPIVNEVRGLLAGDWSDYRLNELTSYLSHADRRVRLESQWELARRKAVDELLRAAADANADQLTRLHGTWGADQIARLDPDQNHKITTSLTVLLDDPDPVLRAAGAKVMGERDHPSAAKPLQQLLADPSPRVRYFATMALADLRDSTALPAVVQLLAADNNHDPALRHAAVCYLARQKAPRSVADLRKHSNESVRRAAVVALRRLKSGLTAEFLTDSSELVVLEAARAIHDLPIPIAADALAESIVEPSENAELVRRRLNANYRLGTAESALRLADYAANASAPAAMRVMSLDMLAAWEANDPRDLVLGDHRPLANRNPQQAAAAIESRLDSLLTAVSPVRSKATRVAAALGVQKIAPQILNQVNNTELEPADRASALTALAQLDPTAAGSFAQSVPLHPVTELTRAAVRVLAATIPNDAVPILVAATDSRDSLLRQQAWDLLAKSNTKSSIEAIADAVDRYLDGSLPADVHLNVSQAADGNVDPVRQERLDAYRAALAQSDPLGQWLPALEGGDAEAGGKLFFEKTQLSCVRCHRIGSTGGEIGPELGFIAKDKDRRYLLEAICLPNATIAKGFDTVVLADDSGRVHTGIIRAESEDSIELIQADGQQRSIATDEVVARRQGQSAMPADLVNQMTLRELRDLVAFLATLK